MPSSKGRVDGMGGTEQATVTLRLPSTLSACNGGKSQIVVRASTVGELFEALEAHYPQVWRCLCDEHGCVRAQIQLFVSNKLITGPHDLQTVLRPGEEIIVLPSARTP
ncbi:ubiquitin family protein [Thermogemmatispora tikiterensis]|nr:MoaD/ThiS family protein [Thermogemmatispora tikiterensis]